MSKHVYPVSDHGIYNVCGSPLFIERQAVLFDDEEQTGEETYFIDENGIVPDYGDANLPNVFEAYSYIGKKGDVINPISLNCAIDTQEDGTLKDVLQYAKCYFFIQQPPELLDIEFNLCETWEKNIFRVKVHSNWLCFGADPIEVNLETMICEFRYCENLTNHRKTFAGKFIDPILWYEANYPGEFKLSINFVPDSIDYDNAEEVEKIKRYQDIYLPILQKYIADYSAKRRKEIADAEEVRQKHSKESRDKWLATSKDYRYVCLTRNAVPSIEKNENK